MTDFSRRYVYQDLHPYCCTFEGCTTAHRLYDSRRAWLAHELEAHHSSFQCIQGCSKIFQAEAEFETHVKARHNDLAAPGIYSILQRSSARGSDLMEMTICRLCGKHLTLRAMQKHLGYHQEQLALFALPANLDEIEDDRDKEEQDSLLGNEGGREEGEDGETDTSDLSESELEVEESVNNTGRRHESPAPRLTSKEIVEAKDHPDHGGLVIAQAAPPISSSIGDGIGGAYEDTLDDFTEASFQDEDEEERSYFSKVKLIGD